MDVLGIESAGGGRQLDGRLRRRRAGDLVPDARAAARARLGGDLLAEPAPRPAAGAARADVGRGRGPRARARHRRHRDAAAAPLRRARQAVVRYPENVSDALAHELVRSARRTDGFLPALQALAGYDLEEELPKISCPTLIVWGAQRHAGPGRGRRAVRGPDRPDSRREVFEDTGPRGDARAAGALQPAVARSSSRSEPGAARRQRVTAPSEALETSFAYLPRTPLPCSTGGS